MTDGFSEKLKRMWYVTESAEMRQRKSAFTNWRFTKRCFAPKVATLTPTNDWIGR